MVIQLKEEDLHKNNLSWVCIEPLLLTVRGKELARKEELYYRLNEGQRALYMFYAFHNHVNSSYEFYWFSAYFMNELKAWDGLKKGVRFFHEHDLLSLLEDFANIIEMKNKRADGTWKEITNADLENDSHLYASVSETFNQYRLLAQRAIGQMNLYIRNHPEAFVEIVE